MKKPKVLFFCVCAYLLGAQAILFPAAGSIFISARGGLTDEQYGFLFLPMVAAAIAAAFFFRVFWKRWGGPALFYASLGFNAAYLVTILAAAPNPDAPSGMFFLLIVGQILYGIGFGIHLPTLNLYTVDVHPARRASLLAALHGSFGLGATSSPLLVNFFRSAGNWTAAVWVMALCAIAAAMLAHRTRFIGAIAPVAQSGDGKPEPLPRLAKAFVLMMTVYGTAEAMIGNWSIPLLTQSRGYEMSAASICLSLFWGGITAGRLLASPLSAKINPRYLLRFAPLVLFAGLSLLQITGRGDTAGLYVSYIIMGLGCSYFFPMSVSIVTHYFDSHRERLAGLMITGLMIGVGVGSSAIGAIRDRGWATLEQAFLAAWGISLGLAVLAFLWTRRRLPEEK